MWLFLDLLCLGLSETLDVVNFFLSPNWEHLRHYFFKYLVLLYFLSSLLLQVQLHNVWHSDIVSQVLKTVNFFNLFSLFFKLYNSHWSVFELINSFFYPIHCVLIPFSEYFYFRYCIFQFCNYYFYSFYFPAESLIFPFIMRIFFFISLSIVILVVLRSLSDTSNIWVFLEVGFW